MPRWRKPPRKTEIIGQFAAGSILPILQTSSGGSPPEREQSGINATVVGCCFCPVAEWRARCRLGAITIHQSRDYGCTRKPRLAHSRGFFVRSAGRRCPADCGVDATMPAMAELLLRRAIAAPGEVYDVLSGRRTVGRIILSNGSAASQWSRHYPTATTRNARQHRLRGYLRRCHEGVRPELG
jgi:hypothetical protein